MRPVSLGIIGCGNVMTGAYTTLLKSLVADGVVELVAVCDVNAEAARRAAGIYGGSPIVAAHDELIHRDDIELIVVLTSMAEHGPFALEALRAGKHVFVEKPMAVTRSQAAELLETARTSDRYLGCAPAVILSPTYQAMAAKLRAGAIGRPALARARYGWSGPDWSEWYFRESGGPLFDLGVYNLTSLTGLLGPVRGVQAMAGIVTPRRIVDGEPIDVTTFDNYQILLDFGDDVFGIVTTGFSMQRYRSPALEIYGSDGTMQMLGDDWAPEGYELWENNVGAWQVFDTSSRTMVVDRWTPPSHRMRRHRRHAVNDAGARLPRARHHADGDGGGEGQPLSRRREHVRDARARWWRATHAGSPHPRPHVGVSRYGGAPRRHRRPRRRCPARLPARVPSPRGTGAARAGVRTFGRSAPQRSPPSSAPPAGVLTGAMRSAPTSMSSSTSLLLRRTARSTSPRCNAGKHLYSEKPVARDRDEGARIAEAAAASGSTVVAAPSVMVFPQVRRASDLLATGMIGTVNSVRAHGTAPPPPWTGYDSDSSPYFGAEVGPLSDMGVYPLHAITGLLGPVVEVAAMSDRTRDAFTVVEGPYAGERVRRRVGRQLAAHHAPRRRSVVVGAVGLLHPPAGRTRPRAER